MLENKNASTSRHDLCQVLEAISTKALGELHRQSFITLTESIQHAVPEWQDWKNGIFYGIVQTVLENTW